MEIDNHIIRASVTAAAVTAFITVLSVASCSRSDSAAAESGFEIVVLDANDIPLACRIHLRGPDGKVWTSSEWPSFDDHFVYSGRARFPLTSGSYTYEIERGPEYQRLQGSFRIGLFGQKALRVRIERVADMAATGWYSGDLHIHRDVKDVPLLMQAEDLHIAPVVTWWNSIEVNRSANASGGLVALDGRRFVEATAGEDEREGGALLFFHLGQALKLPSSMRNDRGQIIHREGDERDEYPSPAQFAREAHSQPGVHVDIEKPFWWDVATWVALGSGDSIGIAYNQMTRASLHNGEAWGKERDPNRYDGSFGNAYWSQDIYYRILETGIRLAPSAGSASGALPNPIGYDRVYVHLDGPLQYDQWWQGLKAGHSIVTNGPLLLVKANGELPGHVFATRLDAPVDVALDVRVISNESIDRVELVRNGRVVEIGARQGEGTFTFTSQSFEASGWFLVRAFADRTDNFRFASTAPFYVEVAPSHPRRISRAAVQFFADWVEERMRRIRAGSMPPEKLAAVLQYHEEAARFWRQRLMDANAP